MNQYETQEIREQLVAAGFMECLSREVADLYIVNTCTVTEKADRQSRHIIGLFHKTNPDAKIVVTGCYAERDSADISFLPGVNHIIKNIDKSRIADILNDKSDRPVNGKDTILNTPASPAGGQYARRNSGITGFSGHTKAFVKIQDGCENRCAYCKVPLVRGASVSRPIKEVVEEVKTLVGNGFKEIVLTGICLGAWGKDMSPSWAASYASLGLVDVLKAINGIGGDFRIRLSSIEPIYVTGELLRFIAENSRMCRHLHIPLQSGDDDVLKRMKRPYTSEGYKAIVDDCRKKIEGIAITTDIMVGFPGESEENFKNTVRFVKDVLPARTHIFTFSKRAGTAAFEMKPEIDIDTMKRRYCELNVAALGSSCLYRSDFLDKKLDILVESKRDRLSGMLAGYSGNYIRTLFEGADSLMKNIVPVKIYDVNLIRTLGVYEDDSKRS